MHNSPKFPLAHVVQEKNAGSELKKCLCVRINFHKVESSAPLMLWSIQTESNYTLLKLAILYSAV